MDLVSVQILILQVGFLCNNLMLRFGNASVQAYFLKEDKKKVIKLL